MTSPVSAAVSTAAPETKQTGDSLSNLAQKDTFLKLLVAQIRNQNPLNPADGVQFLSQLAQFSELEQMMQIRTEIEALRTDLAARDTSPASGVEATKET